jgi:uncharacterized protein with von Willebrand factor type A (vWA) domain
MSDPYILPDFDPFEDEDREEQEAIEEEQTANTTDWRGATDMQSFLEAYSESERGPVHEFESARQQQQSAQSREARIQQAQQAIIDRGNQRPDWADAKDLASMMVAYERAGGLVSGDYTVAEDSDGRLAVYEVV